MLKKRIRMGLAASWRLLVIMVLCGYTMLAFAAADMLQITNVRVSVLSNQSRLVFDLSGQPNYVLFTLANPNRLVLDIKNAKLLAHLNKNTLKDTPIKHFRAGRHQQDGGYFRIVMDLTKPVSAKSFVLAPAESNGYRLVIDLDTHVKTSAAKIVAAPKMSEKMIEISTSEAGKTDNSKAVVINNPVQNAVDNSPAKVATKTMTPAAITPVPAMPSASAPKPIVTLPTNGRLKPRDIIIVIDPGHGGKDPGTTGPGGTHEKNVVLAIARNLQRMLNAEPGFHAVLTRDSDYYIPLRGRLDIARHDKADMFISIHADAFKDGDAMGASVYALSERGATSEAARWLAEKENTSELMGGVNLPGQDNILRSVLIDLSQTHTISVSLQIGNAVLRQLSYITQLHHNRVEQAAFVVLKSPDIPSLLIETGFLSSPRQERQLRNPRYQEQLANSILQGIKSYFVRNPPQGTLLS